MLVSDSNKTETDLKTQQQDVTAEPSTDSAASEKLAEENEEKLAEENEIVWANKFETGWWTQYKALWQRAWIVKQSDTLDYMQAIQVGCVAVIVSLVWFQSDLKEENIQDRFGLVFSLPFSGRSSRCSTPSRPSPPNARYSCAKGRKAHTGYQPTTSRR
mmetsp:Transcript_11151/g.21363  ORF Transcript_11151/g.21363 Transcript_11151/m.21363 type:complete len:159 (-) Transcript_11151:745-1221(-)